MDSLVRGYHRFIRHVFPQKKKFYAELAKGQTPPYLFITCSDSRVMPNEFTQADPGVLFFERSIGNIVPMPGSGEHEAKAAIEYAVEALHIKHIIICGHTKCGAVQAMLEPEVIAGTPDVQRWLRVARFGREAFLEKHRGLSRDELWEEAVRENVRNQLEHVKLLPCVAKGLENGTLTTWGWVYDIENGRLSALDALTGEFAPVDGPAGKRIGRGPQ